MTRFGPLEALTRPSTIKETHFFCQRIMRALSTRRWSWTHAALNSLLCENRRRGQETG